MVIGKPQQKFELTIVDAQVSTSSGEHQPFAFRYVGVDMDRVMPSQPEELKRREPGKHWQKD